MSDTPRTDEQEMSPRLDIEGTVVSSDFARQLEHELAEARKQLEDFEIEATNAINDIVRVKYQRDTLAEVLKLCEKHLEKHGREKCDEELDETGWWLLCDVRTALATVKGGSDD